MDHFKANTYVKSWMNKNNRLATETRIIKSVQANVSANEAAIHSTVIHIHLYNILLL